ncbi:hypothetical protein [Pseudoxanthomonas sp.]|uniref:hypothetical protein n=1 Tax=Pseudoxanthomonas sp. TaxID=1871049 RepID=UPI002E14FA5A|nr:hypothetical protein [Pseudoxanthomonas sp.]
MKRLSARLAGGREKEDSTQGPASDGPAPPAMLYPAALDAAIESAWFAARSHTDDGPRVCVHCPALGGGFIYDKTDIESRILRHFPECDAAAVQRASLHLRSRFMQYIRESSQPIRQRQSWLHGWRN